MPWWLTLRAFWKTASPWMIHEGFLMPRALTGKLYFSGQNPSTPIIRDDVQQGLRRSIRTWRTCTLFFNWDYTTMDQCKNVISSMLKCCSPVDYRMSYRRPLGPLLLKWFNLNPSISNFIHHKVWDEITNPFPNFNSATVEVWEWISNLISHFTGHVITYPCWDIS